MIIIMGDMSNKKAFLVANKIESSLECSSEESSNELSTPDINNIIEKTCKDNKVTLDTLIKKLSQLMESKKIIIDKYGDEHFEEDSATQHKATMSLLELLKYIKGGTVNVQVNITEEERQILRMYDN